MEQQLLKKKNLEKILINQFILEHRYQTQEKYESRKVLYNYIKNKCGSEDKILLTDAEVLYVKLNPVIFMKASEIIESQLNSGITQNI